MTDVTFSPADRAHLIQKLQTYMDTELKIDIGRFDAEFLLDFVSREFGAYYYNQGLYDAQAVVTSRVTELGEAIAMLERTTEPRR